MPYSYNATLVKVIDGDSVTLQVDVGFNILFTATFQLAGLDAPELVGARGRDGKLVKKELTEWLRSADRITVQPTGGTTGAGRWYARVDVFYADGKGFCVNDELLSRGLAAQA
jgi:endonuclease YncB( thermonuclease family)